jgi:trehalose-phosphatase
MGGRHHPQALEIRVSPPRPLFSDWSRLAERLRAAPARVLLTDCDGTLVRIRRRPSDVRLAKSTARLLVAIRDAGCVVGVVSGRGIESLVSLVGIPGIWYAGSHGYRLRDPGGRTISLATPAERRRIGRATRWLRPRVARIPGVHLDVKHASVAVHYRTASPRATRRAREVIDRLLERDPRLLLLSGKKVWELLPGESVDKGVAVQRLLEEIRAPRGRFVAYLGDDTTDESVFRKLADGVTIVVGRRPHTAARYSLRSMGEVGELLRRWLRVAREARGRKSPKKESAAGAD